MGQAGLIITEDLEGRSAEATFGRTGLPEPVTYHDGRAVLHVGDCRAVMARLPAESIDAIVTDPPYELGFMGKSWDCAGIAFSVEMWSECWRVLKPGGHLLAFGGTRTQHRMVCAIEDAGFEIRDQMQWIYGCLSEDTEILTPDGFVHYHKVTIGSLVCGYNLGSNELEWMPVEAVPVYDYSDTAYRLQSDSTDQLVSRNHRCVVERGGGYVFEFAEALEREARVPVLEGVQDLLEALCVPHERASPAQPDVLEGVRGSVHRGEQYGQGEQERESVAVMSGLRQPVPALADQEARGSTSCMFSPVPRQERRGSDAGSRQEGPGRIDCGIHGVVLTENERREQPGMEGRGHLLSETRQLQTDQACSLPGRVSTDGPQGRLCHGAPADRGKDPTALPNAPGSHTPRRPRSPEQRAYESDAVCQQPRSQAVRASRFTRSDLVRVSPCHYVGKVWCVRVRSGAFVARRNGKAFITGNSGFPKSLDVSKAIDKQRRRDYVLAAVELGLSIPGNNLHDWTKAEHAPGDEWWEQFKAVLSAEQWGEIERAVVARGFRVRRESTVQIAGLSDGEFDITAPSTPKAKQWDGWGTALKPAHEPICVARKPLSEGNVAANVLAHGTGAINVDGCRIEGTAGSGVWGSSNKTVDPKRTFVASPDAAEYRTEAHPLGRWPSNVILDPEAARLLDQSTGELTSGANPTRRQSDKFRQAYGEFKGQEECQPVRGTDSGGASRFFYCAKASQAERGEGNNHPTVKPLALMRYLVRLVTPPGGTVLDPFAGSGTTGLAVIAEGFNCILIEREPAHAEIIASRLAPGLFGAQL